MKRLIAIPSLLFALLLVAPGARALELGVIGPMRLRIDELEVVR